MYKLQKILISILAIIVLLHDGLCKDIDLQTGTEYFLSTKSSSINSRVGPGLGYKVCWMYKQAGLPLKVIEEFENWVHIVDIDNKSGWICKNMLSHNRYIQIKKDTTVFKKHSNKSDVVASVKKYVIAKLLKIKGEWCMIEIFAENKTYKGWVFCDKVFGI